MRETERGEREKERQRETDRQTDKDKELTIPPPCIQPLRTILWKMEFLKCSLRSVSSLCPFSPVHNALKLAHVLGTWSENS